MKKRDWIFVVIFVCLAAGSFIYTDREQILEILRREKTVSLPAPVSYDQTQDAQAKTNPAPVAKTPVTKPVEKTPSVVQEKTTKAVFAPEINLAVPFTSQAPTGNWKQPFQDACEEASVLMVREYFAGNKSAVLDATAAEKSLQSIVALENELFGYYIDTTVLETALFAEKMYGFSKSDIIENPTIDQIKERLNLGEPVLVPAYGIALKNPYFVQPGPPYHMLVIRGYTKDNKFITNDPGTKHGAGYLYSFDVLMGAMHDWNAKDMLQGKKAVLILHPKK